MNAAALTPSGDPRRLFCQLHTATFSRAESVDFQARILYSPRIYSCEDTTEVIQRNDGPLIVGMYHKA